jgi:hypothetical protein
MLQFTMPSIPLDVFCPKTGNQHDPNATTCLVCQGRKIRLQPAIDLTESPDPPRTTSKLLYLPAALRARGSQDHLNVANKREQARRISTTAGHSALSTRTASEVVALQKFMLNVTLLHANYSYANKQNRSMDLKDVGKIVLSSM